MKRVLSISLSVLVVLLAAFVPVMATDGRLNSSPDDAAAPLVVFCSEENSIDVWRINSDGHGTFGFNASAEAVAAGIEATAANGTNTLIAGEANDGLYALVSNELALISFDLKEPWKGYVFSFPHGTC